MTTKLTVKVAWWVQPYLDLLMLMFYVIAPFLEEDDPTIDWLLKLHSGFICRFGIRCLAD
ncbi:hypothetical protein [Devosia submarina]|uniref:hypothetical protein n=1 Tax=Devosia submarina TaxID=1173082 RepID=UPI000D332C83|nr:hypothetical protein [Devosia submarina]